MNTKKNWNAKGLLLGGLIAVVGLPAHGQETRSLQQQDVLLNKLTAVVNSQSQLIQQLQDQLQQKGGSGKTTSRQGVTTEVTVGRISAQAADLTPISIPLAEAFFAGTESLHMAVLRDAQPAQEETISISYPRLISPHATLPVPGFGEILLWCFKSSNYNAPGGYELVPGDLPAGAVRLNTDPQSSQARVIYGFRNTSSKLLLDSSNNDVLIPPNSVLFSGESAGNSSTGVGPGQPFHNGLFSLVSPSFNSQFKEARIVITELSAIRSSLNPFFLTEGRLNENTCRSFVTATITTGTP